MISPVGAGRPGALRVLWESVRPRSLVVAATSSILGTASVAPIHAVRPLVAIACLVLSLLLQGATNVLNDAEDALTGADDYAGAGSSVAIKRAWITPRHARMIAAALFAVAAVLGLTLAIAAGRPALLLLGLGALVVGWAYTAPPLRLAYRPLGELASAVPMGLGIVWGTAAAQADHVPAATWWAAAPVALLTAAILHANNARDRVHDASVGKRTLATHLSERGVVAEFRLLTGGVGLVIVAALLTRGLPLWCLLALAPALLAARAGARVHVGIAAREWTLRLIDCVRLHGLTGIALAAGLVLSALTS